MPNTLNGITIFSSTLKPAFKVKWIKALRSGKYKQGSDYLHKNQYGHDTYCCLGVACDISNLGHWNESLVVGMAAEDGAFAYTTGSRVAVGIWKKDVYNLLFDEIEDNLGAPHLIHIHTKDYSRRIDLTVLNDNGFTFDQIADIIDYFM